MFHKDTNNVPLHRGSIAQSEGLLHNHVFIERPQVIIANFYVKIGFVSANNEDPDEILHYALFFHSTHLGVSSPQRISNKVFASNQITLIWDYFVCTCFACHSGLVLVPIVINHLR